MVPRQFRFLEIFNDALNEFLKTNNGILLTPRVNNSPIEWFIKMSLKE
jgi:hypothetical protein